MSPNLILAVVTSGFGLVTIVCVAQGRSAGLPSVVLGTLFWVVGFRTPVVAMVEVLEGRAACFHQLRGDGAVGGRTGFSFSRRSVHLPRCICCPARI